MATNGSMTVWLVVIVKLLLAGEQADDKAVKCNALNEFG